MAGIFLQRVAPVVVELHQRGNPLGGHAGAHGFLLLGRGVERAVVHSDREADTLTDVGRPVGRLADVLELEEGDALAAADVVEDVAHP